jgi:2-iminobutanoate/2-iminopropanoate deaminase
MSNRVISSAEAPVATVFAQAIEASAPNRWLYVSGQIPAGPDGVVPPRFEDQARLAWANVLAQVRAAGMVREDLVKVTIFLTDRANIAAHRDAYDAALGDHLVAVSTIITDLLNEAWLIEIEAVAAA